MLPDNHFETDDNLYSIFKKESNTSLIIAFSMITTIGILAFLAHYLPPYRHDLSISIMENIFFVLNIISVIEIITILALRKKVYFTSNLIKMKNNPLDVLKKWRVVDTIFMALGESIAIFGFFLSIMGMPFKRTYHFFIVAALLVIICLPFKLRIENRWQKFIKWIETETP